MYSHPFSSPAEQALGKLEVASTAKSPYPKERTPHSLSGNCESIVVWLCDYHLKP